MVSGTTSFCPVLVMFTPPRAQNESSLTTPVPINIKRPLQPMRCGCFYPAKTCLRHQCHKMSLRPLPGVQVHSVIITLVTTRHNTLPSQPSKKRCRSRIRRGVSTLFCSVSKGLCFGFPAALPMFILFLSGARLGVFQSNLPARKLAGNEKGNSDHFWEGRAF